MILKGSQRGGAGQLAAHLMNERDNEHVELLDMRGFVASDLKGALGEASAVASGTRCKQFLFSLSLNPPKGGEASVEDLVRAADRAEAALGLQGQPRALVLHEKDGRRHMHVVWSRIDGKEMTAINMPFFKTRLAELSKDLYLDHGWDLPDGHKENGWKSPLNFTLAEWQQAKRLDLRPDELKQLFQTTWKQSDDLASFRNALAAKGYILAKGDRRAFVAIDMHGEVFSVARMLGMKTKEVEARLGKPEAMPSVETAKANNQARLTGNLRDALKEAQRAQRRELTPLRWERRRIVRAQRTQRVELARTQKQHRAMRTKARATRIKDGWRGVLQLLTGRLPHIRQQNAEESFEDYQQYRRQVARLVEEQMHERQLINQRLLEMHTRQRAERMAFASRVGVLLRLQEEGPGRAHRRDADHLRLEM